MVITISEIKRNLPLDILGEGNNIPLDVLGQQFGDKDMAKKKTTILQGSLDLLVMQTLQSGAKHGYAITRHLMEVSEEFLRVEEGSLYPALHRMEKKGWIKSRWGTSESNRRAKYYELTPAGRQQLKDEVVHWKKLSKAVNQVLGYSANLVWGQV